MAGTALLAMLPTLPPAFGADLPCEVTAFIARLKRYEGMVE